MQVITKHGVGRLMEIDKQKGVVTVEFDYMYQVELPLEEVLNLRPSPGFLKTMKGELQ